jgi:peptide/nickel transport system substrate-binding protein
MRFGFCSSLAAATFIVTSLISTDPVAAAPTAHVLRFATAEEVATLNPDINQQAVVGYLDQMTAAYAFRLDHENRLVPELATVVPTTRNGGISADGKTITLHLRQHVKWSDGAPFDADDVAFTISAINNPANLVPSRDGFDQITHIDEPNKYTAIFHLKAPFGAIVPTLFASNGGTAILPKHLLAGLHDMNEVPFNSLPVGIGPFRYVAWKRGDEIELERNPYYWRGAPALERVIMKLVPDRNTVLTELQTGELDLWYPFGGSFLSRVQAIPGVHVIRQAGYGLNQFMLNTSHPVLADVAVRQALRLGVDRKTILEKAAHGVGILQDAPFPTIDPSTPKDIPYVAYDPTKANALLDAAGWKLGSDGVRSKNGARLSLNLASSTGSPDVDTLIELLRSDWAKIGVDLQVQRYTSALLFGPIDQGGILNNGKFDVLLLGQDIPAPFNLTNVYSCDKAPPAGQNFSHYCNPKVDVLDAQYDRTYDDADRAKLLSRVVHIVNDDVPVIVYIGREDCFGVNDAVKNFTPNAATPFDDMMRVDVLP